MDKNGKIFGKVSIIDIFAIIIITGVFAGTVYKFVSPNTSIISNQKQLVYTLNINGVRDFTIDYYKKGLQCFDMRTDEYVGEIVDVREVTYKERVLMKDGTYKIFEKPNVIAIDLDIQTPGTVTDAAYFSRGTYELKVGSEINLKTKYIEVVGIIENIKEL